MFTVKRRSSAQLFDLHGCVSMEILQLVTQFPMFVLDRHVSTQRVDYQTCSHTKRRVSAHFLSYELISMRTVKHMTPCSTPNFLQTGRNDVQPHDFLTYEPFSLCNF